MSPIQYSENDQDRTLPESDETTSGTLRAVRF